MKLKWHGHSCFELTLDNGMAIITDPFDDTVGYPLCRARADVVLSTHDHFDHNHFDSLAGNPVILREPGAREIGGARITGVRSFHDPKRGALRGENIIYLIEASGMRIAHLGDLGHEPNLKQYAALTNIDVLLIPIGGYYTIDTDTALKVIDHVRPRVVIPMHFKTPLMDFPITDEKRFVEKTGAVYWDKRWVEVTRENIDSLPRALVLKYQD